MDFLRSYSLSLICGTMVCGILAGIVRDGLFQKQIKLLCGLFLALTIVKPLIQLELPSLEDIMEPLNQEAISLAADGKKMYQDALAKSIQQETEAYICSRAELLQTNLRVQVHMSNTDPPLPDSVSLEGVFLPDVKHKLQKILEDELSIPKERQTWIGQQ